MRKQIQQWVADIANENSDIIEPFLLGKSYEGREINGFRVTILIICLQAIQDTV